MNRTSKLFAAGLGALLFSLGAMAQGPVAHYQKSDNPLSGELRFDKKGQFKIVQFTDVHFCFGNHDKEFDATNEQMYDMIRSLPYNLHPDRCASEVPDIFPHPFPGVRHCCL